MAEGGYGSLALPTRIDQIFGKGADDAIPSRIHRSNFVPVFTRSLYQSAGGSIDNGSNPARLCIKRIFTSPHGDFLLFW